MIYTKACIPPNISWKDHVPYATAYDDVYYQTSGLEEARYVFLTPNNLEAQFSTKQHVCITEIGLGSGLNMLATWEAWKKYRKPKHHLHYIAIEKHPLSITDLKQAHKAWPELYPHVEAFYAMYPERIRGIHQRHNLEEGFHITFLFFDVLEALEQLDASVDVWYLDGFSPKTNQAMWTNQVFKLMANLSVPQASFSTFTAASYVRKGLEQAGFEVEKSKGFGKKREMLSGVLVDTSKSLAPTTRSYENVIIIGAGMAGCSCAYYLDRYGISTTIIDRAPILASEASGNPLGVVMPAINAPNDVLGALYMHGFLHAIDTYKRLSFEFPAIGWQACGVLEGRTTSKQSLRKFNNVEKLNLPEIFQPLSQTQASDHAGMELLTDGISIPRGGYLNPKALCEAYILGSKRVQLQLDKTVSCIIPVKNGYSVLDCRGEVLAHGSAIILANSFNAGVLATPLAPYLDTIKGQLTYLQEDQCSSKLRRIISADRYMLPSVDGRHVIGASFTRGDSSMTLREADDQASIESLASTVTSMPNKVIGGRVGFRCVSTDKAPIIGALEPPFERVYVSAAHGARGLITTPLAAQWISQDYVNAPSPLIKDIQKRVSPKRFLFC